MVIWSSFILDEMAGLRNDALPTCPECEDDPAFLAKNSGVVTAHPGPVRRRAGHLRRGHVVDDPGRGGHRPGQAVRRVHDDRRLRAVDRHRPRGQDPGARRRTPPTRRSTPTRGPAWTSASTPRRRSRSSTARRSSTRSPPAPTPSAAGRSRRARVTCSAPSRASSRWPTRSTRWPTAPSAEEAVAAGRRRDPGGRGLAVTISGPRPAGATVEAPDPVPRDREPRRGRSARAREDRRTGYLLISPTVVIVFTMVVLPILWTISLAFQHVRLLNLRTHRVHRRLQPRQLRERPHLARLRRRARHHARLLGVRHRVRDRPRAGGGAGAAAGRSAAGGWCAPACSCRTSRRSWPRRSCGRRCSTRSSAW